MRQLGATQFSFQMNLLDDTTDNEPNKKTPVSALTLDSNEVEKMRGNFTTPLRSPPTPINKTNSNTQSKSSHMDEPNSQEAD